MALRFRPFSLLALGLAFLAVLVVNQGLSAQRQAPAEYEYLVLATTKTSTMEKELQEAAESGYRFAGAMGGKRVFGGEELVVVMQRDSDSMPRFEYKLLSTSKTSTMQKELQEAGDAGFAYRGQTTLKKESVVILERDRALANLRRFEYRVLATQKTSTMQDELRVTGAAGFDFAGVTVAPTTFGGKEAMVILRRLVTDS